jgi:hypothetical protein
VLDRDDPLVHPPHLRPDRDLLARLSPHQHNSYDGIGTWTQCAPGPGLSPDNACIVGDYPTAVGIFLADRSVRGQEPGVVMGKRLKVMALAFAAWGLMAIAGVSTAAAERPSVLCWNNASPGYGQAGVRVKPKRCSLIKQGGFSTADTAYLLSMNWKSWGHAGAKGGGTLAGNMGFRAPINVRLKKPVRNCEGEFVFSKAHFNSSENDIGEFAMRLYTCPDQGKPKESSTVYSIEGCVHPKPEPTLIVFACADNGLYIDGLIWTD